MASTRTSEVGGLDGDKEDGEGESCPEKEDDGRPTAGGRALRARHRDRKSPHRQPRSKILDG